MFDFLGGALRKIGNIFNAEFRDFKRALFSQFFKSNSNSNQPEQDKSSISENDVLLPRSEQDKKDLKDISLAEQKPSEGCAPASGLA